MNPNPNPKLNLIPNPPRRNYPEIYFISKSRIIPNSRWEDMYSRSTISLQGEVLTVYSLNNQTMLDGIGIGVQAQTKILAKYFNLVWMHSYKFLDGASFLLPVYSHYYAPHIITYIITTYIITYIITTYIITTYIITTYIITYIITTYIITYIKSPHKLLHILSPHIIVPLWQTFFLTSFNYSYSVENVTVTDKSYNGNSHKNLARYWQTCTTIHMFKNVRQSRPSMLFIIVSTMLLNEQCCIIISTMLLNEQCCSLMFQQCCCSNEQCCSLLFQQCCWTNNVVHYCFDNVVYYCFNNVVHYCSNNVVEWTMLFIIVSTMLLNGQWCFQHWWKNNGSQMLKQETANYIDRTSLFTYC